jgi:hypothetical protein
MWEMVVDHGLLKVIRNGSSPLCVSQHHTQKALSTHWLYRIMEVRGSLSPSKDLNQETSPPSIHLTKSTFSESSISKLEIGHKNLCFPFSFFFFWEKVSLGIDSSGWPELMILLPLPPKCWNYRHVSSCPANLWASNNESCFFSTD